MSHTPDYAVTLYGDDYIIYLPTGINELITGNQNSTNNIIDKEIIELDYSRQITNEPKPIDAINYYIEN